MNRTVVDPLYHKITCYICGRQAALCCDDGISKGCKADHSRHKPACRRHHKPRCYACCKDHPKGKK